MNDPRLLAAGLCGGLALADVTRVSIVVVALLSVVAVVSAPRAVAAIVCLALVGWWWGSARLDQLDRSVLVAHVGEAARVRLVVTGPSRAGSFEVRTPARVVRYAASVVHDRTATPSRSTVHAPHWLVSQPTLVPVMPAMFLMKCVRSRRGSTPRS